MNYSDVAFGIYFQYCVPGTKFNFLFECLFNFFVTIFDSGKTKI